MGGFSWARKCSVEMDGELSEGHQSNNASFIVFCRRSVNWSVLHVRCRHVRWGLRGEKLHLLNVLLLQALFWGHHRSSLDYKAVS